MFECGFDDFVYDIETTDGTFQAGVGQMIVKNTDSIFVNFSDHIRQKYPGREFTEKELLDESIEIGLQAAANINSHMKKPQNIEYEKTFWPFCIFSKKRYFGNKYTDNSYKYKQTSMGIVLKRRDNAPIVKKIYGGVIDIILNKRDIDGSKKFFYNSIKDLLQGKVDIGELVISKTIKTTREYANPTTCAHKVLADRMGERDPGNKPQSNDRIPYVYIDITNHKCIVCNTKVKDEENCKCVKCMKLFCAFHVNNHRECCTPVCRFCRLAQGETDLKECSICNGIYCEECYDRHKIGKSKGVEHNNKCKKPLTNKLLQGDRIEYPLFIIENKWKIDYSFYLTNQIEKPVLQIFELVMKNPASIISDLVQKMKNDKAGNKNIKDWFKVAMKKQEEQKLKQDEQEQIEKEKQEILQKIKFIDNGDDDDEGDMNALDGFEQDVIGEGMEDIIE